jgi:MFS family permease
MTPTPPATRQEDADPVERHGHILNASSNLLGICFVIITGLRITHSSPNTYGDELAWAAALCFLASIAMSFLTIRRGRPHGRRGRYADHVFMVGVAALTVATLLVAFELS